jgi:hypothetical protein
VSCIEKKWDNKKVNMIQLLTVMFFINIHCLIIKTYLISYICIVFILYLHCIHVVSFIACVVLCGVF